MSFRLIYLAMFILLVNQIYSDNPYEIQHAKIQGPHFIEIAYSGQLSTEILDNLKIEPEISVGKAEIQDSMIKIHTDQPMLLHKHYYLRFPENQRLFLIPDGILDSLYSDKPLGYQISGEQIYFRLFAPRAIWVKLVLFDHYSDQKGQQFAMQRDDQGIWEYDLKADCIGKYYGYQVWGPQGDGEVFDSTIVVADPYSPATVTGNHYTHPAKTLIMPEKDYNWEGDTWINTPWSDLIIYEMHLRDLTAHPSSGLPEEKRGHYQGLLEKEQRGGLPYIKSLGVNAVELLPCQDYGNLEVPYKDHDAPVYNTWNPYARNHWGYMTSYFFAPESYYGNGANLEAGKYCGADGSQVNEFREMVKAFHANEMAVLMDVVYNHVSQYDYNPLKFIDKFYYFRLENDCSFTSVSGCGNDLKTERLMVRRLIKDSVVHWMRTYHVDGFRFDLAKMIDWQTIDEIRQAARQINPNVILIAEPWGGGYDPGGFSDHSWASWNDKIRNAVKGQNPKDGLGFIFGNWQGENDQRSLQRYITGSLRTDGGQYLSSSHSVNYLESHDDHTMGDFIRIGLRDVREDERLTNPDAHAKLSPLQMKINKLAALCLFVSQGPLMIHEGQEYARSKVIANTMVPEEHINMIDHNSYNKDNETNWLNYEYAELNRELVDYYRGLISIRKSHSVFSRAKQDQYEFYPQADSLFISFSVNDKNKKYLVYLNGNRDHEQDYKLPSGKWGVLANHNRTAETPFQWIENRQLSIPPSSGVILVQE